jgi:head-tail adaptor
MVARNLRQKITIQKNAETVDARGQISGEWSDVATRRLLGGFGCDGNAI